MSAICGVVLQICNPTLPLHCQRPHQFRPKVVPLALREIVSSLPLAVIGWAKPQSKVADPFYSTPEYRAWAAEVKRRAGYRCEAKGCGVTGVRLFSDHIIEIADGGARLDPANGQCLCNRHHTLKTGAERAKRLGRG